MLPLLVGLGLPEPRGQWAQRERRGQLALRGHKALRGHREQQGLARPELQAPGLQAQQGLRERPALELPAPLGWGLPAPPEPKGLRE